MMMVPHLPHHTAAAPDDPPAGAHGPALSVIPEEGEAPDLVKISRKPVEDPGTEIPVNTVTLAVDNLRSPVKLAVPVVTFIVMALCLRRTFSTSTTSNLTSRVLQQVQVYFLRHSASL